MKKSIVLIILLMSVTGFADQSDLKMACKTAAYGMPNGNGATVYYPNGRRLTYSAGTAGATWYYPNGRTLSNSISTPGATYYYSNGSTFSNGTGNQGATWYFSDGRTMTYSGPALSPLEMAELACDLIVNGSVEQ